MQVVAGVTPGKGGQEVQDVPVFNSVKEVIEKVGPVDASMVYVPPLLAYEATIEAIEAQIPLVHIFAEKIPVFDTSRILSMAAKKNVRVLGPASVGAIRPGEGQMRSLAGS